MILIGAFLFGGRLHVFYYSLNSIKRRLRKIYFWIIWSDFHYCFLSNNHLLFYSSDQEVKSHYLFCSDSWFESESFGEGHGIIVWGDMGGFQWPWKAQREDSTLIMWFVWLSRLHEPVDEGCALPQYLLDGAKRHGDRERKLGVMLFVFPSLLKGVCTPGSPSFWIKYDCIGNIKAKEVALFFFCLKWYTK